MFYVVAEVYMPEGAWEPEEILHIFVQEDIDKRFGGDIEAQCITRESIFEVVDSFDSFVLARTNLNILARQLDYA